MTPTKTDVSEQLFELLSESMRLERHPCQGLDYDVSQVVSNRWRVELDSDGYVFTQPWWEESEDEVWHSIRALGYMSFCAIRRVDSEGMREYTVLSCSPSGKALKLVFRITSADNPWLPVFESE